MKDGFTYRQKGDGKIHSFLPNAQLSLCEILKITEGHEVSSVAAAAGIRCQRCRHREQTYTPF